jgi:predicted nuclease with TOPRIM domain
VTIQASSVEENIVKIALDVNMLLESKGYDLSDQDTNDIAKLIQKHINELGYLLNEDEMTRVANTLKERADKITALKENIAALESENSALEDKVMLLEDKVNVLELALDNERNSNDYAINKANELLRLNAMQLETKDELIEGYKKQAEPDVVLRLSLFLAGVGAAQLF